MIKYNSTRGSQQEKTAAQAVIQGIAEDKGLYVPHRIPDLDVSPEALKDATYQEIAEKVISAFFTDYTAEEIRPALRGLMTINLKKKPLLLL